MEISQNDERILKDIYILIRDEINSKTLYTEIVINFHKLSNPNLINYQIISGRTLLYFSICKELFPISRFLLRNGANPNIWKKNKDSPLYAAVIVNNLTLIELLLSFDAKQDIEFVNKKAIHVYAGNRSINGLKILLKYGGNVNESSKFGTPLWFACKFNRHACVKFLLENGAKITPEIFALDLSTEIQQLLE